MPCQSMPIHALPTEVLHDIFAMCDRRDLAMAIRPTCGRFQRIVDRYFVADPPLCVESFNIAVGVDEITINDRPWISDDNDDDSVDDVAYLRVTYVNVTYDMCTNVPASAVAALFRRIAKISAGTHLKVGVSSTFKGKVCLPNCFNGLHASTKTLRVWPMSYGTLAAIPLHLFANSHCIELEKLNLTDADLVANTASITTWLHSEASGDAPTSSEKRYEHLMAPELNVDGETAPPLRQLAMTLRSDGRELFEAVAKEVIETFLHDQTPRRFFFVMFQSGHTVRFEARDDCYHNTHTGERLLVKSGTIQRLL